MPMRPCLDCRRPTEGNRCETCRRTRQHERGTTTERGYGTEHQHKLLQAEHLAATHCSECNEPFTEDNPKTGGHLTPLRFGGGDGSIGPHCRRCNSGWLRTGL